MPSGVLKVIFIILEGSTQRFALPALGRAAGRRPTGKMLRRRKLLERSPESPASGARFVGWLAVVPDFLSVKDLFTKKLDEIIARNFDFGNNPKTQIYKVRHKDADAKYEMTCTLRIRQTFAHANFCSIACW